MTTRVLPPESETDGTEPPRFDVFLSHSSSDKPAVELIGRRLGKEEGLAPFLDKWHLIPGSPWQEALEEALDDSATVAVFFGPTGLNPWHNEEMRTALSRAVSTRDEYRVIPVLLPGADEDALKGFLARRTWVDFRAGLDDEEAFGRLVAGIRGEAVPGRGYELPDQPAPYRGLRRFEAEQAEFFFGRDAEVASLLEKVRGCPFVAVVGASGSGKSSLVRAGLLPALADDALPGSRGWHTLVSRPGAQPLRALAEQLATLVPPSDRLKMADELTDRLATRDDGLASAASALLADRPQPLLLVIDQFEEVFTLGRAEPEQRPTSTDRLIANLSEAVQQLGDRIHVVITLRADFLDHCLRFPRLKDLLQDRQMLLGPLEDHALRDVIVRPAQIVGAFFEKGLVGTILRDVQAQPGALPLLQHALDELWRARREPWLTLEAYEESGGVSGALQRRAEATLEALSPARQDLARNIFLRLTTLGEGVSDTRRRVSRQELYLAGVVRSEVDAVLQALSEREARLVVADAETVEVTHEALIRQWGTLRGWLEADREAFHVHRRLTRAAREWQELERDSGALYRGARLEQAAEWAAEKDVSMNLLESEFLETSRSHQKNELDQLHRRNLYLQGAFAAAAVLAVVALVLFLVARSRQAEVLAAYARGLLRPMGHDRQFMGAIESEALWDLATAEDDEIRVRFLDNGLSSVSKALQLQNRFDYVAHAAVGLSSRLRDRVLVELVRPKLRQADTPRQVREVCIYLGAALGDESPGFAREAVWLSLEVALSPLGTTDLARLREDFPKVVGHLTAKDSAGFVKLLVDAIEQVDDWARIAPFVEVYFAKAAGSLKPDLATRLADAWATKIFEKTLMSEPGEDARTSMDSVLPYVSQPLCDRFCIKALRASLGHVEQASVDTGEKVSDDDAAASASTFASRFSKDAAETVLDLALEGIATNRFSSAHEYLFRSALRHLDSQSKVSVRHAVFQRVLESTIKTNFISLLEVFRDLDGSLGEAEAEQVVAVAARVVVARGDFYYRYDGQSYFAEVLEVSSTLAVDMGSRIANAIASHQAALDDPVDAFMEIQSSLSPERRAFAFNTILREAATSVELRDIADLAAVSVEDSERAALAQFFVDVVAQRSEKFATFLLLRAASDILPKMKGTMTSDQYDSTVSRLVTRIDRNLQEVDEGRDETRALTTFKELVDVWRSIERGHYERTYQDQGLRIGLKMLENLELAMNTFKFRGPRELVFPVDQLLPDVALRLDEPNRKILTVAAADTVRQRAATAGGGELKGIFKLIILLRDELGEEGLSSQLPDAAEERLTVLISEIENEEELEEFTPTFEAGLRGLSGELARDRVISAWVRQIRSLPKFDFFRDPNQVVVALDAVDGVLEGESSLLARDFAEKLSDHLLKNTNIKDMQSGMDHVKAMEGTLRSDLESELTRQIIDRAPRASKGAAFLAMLRWLQAVATAPEVDEEAARVLAGRAVEILIDNRDSDDLVALTEVLKDVDSTLPPEDFRTGAVAWISQTRTKLADSEGVRDLRAMAEFLTLGSQAFGAELVGGIAEESAEALLRLQATWYSDWLRYRDEMEDLSEDNVLSDTLGILTTLLDSESARRIAEKLVGGFKGSIPTGFPSDQEEETEDLDAFFIFRQSLPGLLIPIEKQELVELMKLPTCVGPVRQAVLEELAAKAGRESFPSVWDLVAWAEQEERGRFDLDAPPVRPDSHVPREPDPQVLVPGRDPLP